MNNNNYYNIQKNSNDNLINNIKNHKKLLEKILYKTKKIIKLKKKKYVMIGGAYNLQNNINYDTNDINLLKKKINQLEITSLNNYRKNIIFLKQNEQLRNIINSNFFNSNKLIDDINNKIDENDNRIDHLKKILENVHELINNNINQNGGGYKFNINNFIQTGGILMNEFQEIFERIQKSIRNLNRETKKLDEIEKEVEELIIKLNFLFKLKKKN